MSSKFIIGVWTALVFLMCLIPPWVHTIKIRDIEKVAPAGYYAFYIQVPQYNDYSSVEIDWQRLLLQFIAITALAGGLLLTKSQWRVWKINLENKLLERQLEQLSIKTKINELREGPSEI
ncbi:MAG: hypothetical protein WC130_04365 [Kiritimatiellia bacterium]